MDAQESVGTVELDEAYAEGLKDIETFSQPILLYLFDRAGEVHLIRPPFLDDQPHGAFATRHPCRPNPLDPSIVRPVERTAGQLVVEGVDMLDRTPLLHIEPSIPRFDGIDTAANGWVEGMPWRPRPRGRKHSSRSNPPPPCIVAGKLDSGCAFCAEKRLFSPMPGRGDHRLR